MREASPGLVADLVSECLKGQDLLLEQLSDGRATMNEGCEKAKSAVAHLRHLSRNNMSAETTPKIFALLTGILFEPPTIDLPVMYPDRILAAGTWEDWAELARARYRKQTELLYRLIEAAIGDGHVVDVPGYVRDWHNGDWEEAVAFVCDVIRKKR